MGSLVWRDFFYCQGKRLTSALQLNLFVSDYTAMMADTDSAPPGGYQFPMVRYTDMDEDMKKEVIIPRSLRGLIILLFRSWRFAITPATAMLPTMSYVQKT